MEEEVVEEEVVEEEVVEEEVVEEEEECAVEDGGRETGEPKRLIRTNSESLPLRQLSVSVCFCNRILYWHNMRF